MVTIEDIRNKCFALSTKYHHGPEHTKDLMDLALLTITHCQERIATPVPTVDSPYEQPWGGHP